MTKISSTTLSGMVQRFDLQKEGYKPSDPLLEVSGIPISLGPDSASDQEASMALSTFSENGVNQSLWMSGNVELTYSQRYAGYSTVSKDEEVVGTWG